MSSSSIVVRTNYQICNNFKSKISKTINYIGDKKKADSSIIDKDDYIGDYLSLSDKESFLFEKSEKFYWNMNGDVDPKKEIKGINNLNDKGILWSLIVSFPPDFALNNGLVTKKDYYELTKNFMPTFLTEVGLNLNNVTWFASLHRNTNNPHIHINFFEHKRTISNPKIPYSCIHNLKSNIANYIINNEEFYTLRDKELQSITDSISLQELNKVKKQKLFSDGYRKGLNRLLLDYYDRLPKKGRLQYNSKDIIPYKKDLDVIINYILMHDSTKYSYANYLRLLNEHQKQLNQVYGESKDNKNNRYYESQLNKLYSKIGNEILYNYKVYNSISIIDREKSFLSKHITDLNFKSRSDYATQESRKKIAHDLYKLCVTSGLNRYQTKKVLDNWINKSKYSDINSQAIIETFSNTNTDMSSTEFYGALKKLGYNFERYKKTKDKYFYQELNYKRFINRAVNHLMYEYGKEQNQIIKNMEYELEGF